ALVRRLRIRGAMRGVLSTADLDDRSLVEKARASPGIVGRDLVRDVVPERSFDWNESSPVDIVPEPPRRPPTHHVVPVGFGMKWNIPRCLTEVGCRVTVVPGTAGADEILCHRPDGIFLSNGPGDPQAVRYAIETVRQLIGKRPMFGICLGHQLVSLALGGR